MQLTYQFFLLFYLFDVIGYICDEYVSLAVSKLSTYMKLSQAIAGKTLLPLANGVADIITVIVATQTATSSRDNDLAIGSLFGASLVTTTVVVSAVIWMSSNRRIEGVHISKFS